VRLVSKRKVFMEEKKMKKMKKMIAGFIFSVIMAVVFSALLLLC